MNDLEIRIKFTKFLKENYEYSTDQNFSFNFPKCSGQKDINKILSKVFGSIHIKSNTISEGLWEQLVPSIKDSYFLAGTLPVWSIFWPDKKISAKSSEKYLGQFLQLVASIKVSYFLAGKSYQFGAYFGLMQQ